MSQLHGALTEARYMAEILIGSPTLENFNNYRRALINITRCYPADECSLEQAAHRVTNLIDNAI